MTLILIYQLLTPSLHRPTRFVAEEAMKARREIADYIKNKRTERARIRVSYSVSWNCYVVCAGTGVGTDAGGSWSCDKPCDNLANAS